MLKHIDWVFLRRPLLIFFMMSIFAVVFYIAGNEYKEKENSEYLRMKGDLNSSHSKLKNQIKELALIDQYLEKYKRLESEGFIGEERRLSWMESMRDANKVIKLPEFSFSIQPQIDYIRLGIKANKKIKSVSSKMILDLGLLHEEDLFQVFRLIDENVKSQFTIDSCNLNVGHADKELKVDGENISANCVVSWVSLKVAIK